MQRNDIEWEWMFPQEHNEPSSSSASSDLSKNPWVIVGAGPVGAMQALILTTLFPEKQIEIYDRRHSVIRNHGLEIHKETIDEMTSLLTENIHTLRQMKIQDQALIDRIENTITFLNSTFTSAWKKSKFISTQLIVDKIIEFTKTLNGNVKFELNRPITEEELQALKDGKATNPLAQAGMIFGADGSNSRVRNILFEEPSDHLNKEVLSYLLEIKLEMTSEIGSFDQLKRSILPTLTNGTLHVWNQSRSGVATLHIFIRKNIYDLLHSEGPDKKIRGEHSNPYRRLIDLPEQLQRPIENIISDVIEEGKFDPSSLKITTIPIHVYKARNLVKMINGKILAIVGDSAVGLALARGVNNGFASTVHYGNALFARSFNSHTKDFEAFEEFKKKQFLKLEELMKSIKPLAMPAKNLQRNIVIMNQYNSVMLKLLSGDYEVETAKKEFRKFLKSIGIKNANLNDMFDAFYERDNLPKLDEIHACELAIQARADNKIKDIKFETDVVKLQQTVSYLKDGLYIDDQPPQDISTGSSALESLRAALMVPVFQNKECSRWLYKLNRLYIELQRELKSFRKCSSGYAYVTQDIDLVTKYVNEIPSNYKASNLLINSLKYNYQLINDVINEGKFAFNPIKKLEPEVILQQAKDAFTTILKVIQNKNGKDFKILDSYQHLLNNEKLSDNTKLSILYGFFADNAFAHLHSQVLKLMDKDMYEGNSQERQSVQGVLSAKLKSLAQRENLSALNQVIYRINQCILNGEGSQLPKLNSTLKKFFKHPEMTTYFAPSPQKSLFSTFKKVAFWIFPLTAAWGLLKLAANKIAGNFIGSLVLPARQSGNFKYVATNPSNEVQAIIKAKKRFRLFMATGSILDSVEFQPQRSTKKENERMHIINFNPNAARYEYLVPELAYDAVIYDANVIAYNYLDVGNSIINSDTRISAKTLVKEGIAQVQRLLDRGVPPENIMLKSLSLGGGIATKVAKHFHKRGVGIYLFNSQSFSSITNTVIGLIKSFGRNGYQQSFFSRLLGEIARPFVKLGLAITGWEINAGSAIKHISPAYREYMLIRSRNPKHEAKDREAGLNYQAYRAENRRDDEVITHEASLHMALKLERREMKQNIKKSLQALRFNHTLTQDSLESASELLNDALIRFRKRKFVAEYPFKGHGTNNASLTNRYNGRNGNFFFGDFIDYAKKENANRNKKKLTNKGLK